MLVLDSNSYKKFGSYWRQKREAAGLTQSDVARLLGYSKSQFISNFERGLCNLPLDAQKKLVKLYKVKADEWIILYIEEFEKHLRQAFKRKT